MMENLTVGVFIADETGQLVHANPTARQIWGQSPLVPMSHYDEYKAWRPETGRRVTVEDWALSRAIMSGETIREEILNIESFDGISKVIRNFATPVSTGDGHNYGAIAVIQDITEEHEASKQLEAAKQRAEAANEAKDRFLATLSHELRTPLAPILGAVQMLERRRDTPAHLSDYLGVIKRNAALEARLIDDLLDLNRIVYGKVALVKGVASVHEIIWRAVETCKAQANEKAISIELQFTAPLDTVEADPTRLQQVFWNLLSNAVKFTPEGGAVSIGTRAGLHGYVEASVTDTGRGISPEARDRIFDPFEQGGPHTTERFGGLGLGLAISKRLVELHGGTIEARSEGVGKGCTFIVSLPLAPHERTPDETADNAPAQRPSWGKALLVEDHDDTASMMQQLMEWNGLYIVRAADVASAIAHAKREKFDLLLCDLGLPDGSGLDVMRAIGPANIKGIALTGRGMERDIAECKQAGFIEHLTKPVDLDRLEALIKSLLGGSTPPPERGV